MDVVQLRRWFRISQLAIDAEELRGLQVSIAAVRETPDNSQARETLRGLAAERQLHAQLVPLLAVEARTTDDPGAIAALRDEATRAFDHLARPRGRLSALEALVAREPEVLEHREHLAWVYYLVGSWVQAASTLESLVAYAAPEEALLFLRAAGRLYRNTGYNDRALVAYRAIAVRKPADTDALIALGELMLLPPRGAESPFDPLVAPPRKPVTRVPATSPASTTAVASSAAVSARTPSTPPPIQAAEPSRAPATTPPRAPAQTPARAASKTATLRPIEPLAAPLPPASTSASSADVSVPERRETTARMSSPLRAPAQAQVVRIPPVASDEPAAKTLPNVAPPPPPPAPPPAIQDDPGLGDAHDTMPDRPSEETLPMAGAVAIDGTAARTAIHRKRTWSGAEDHETEGFVDAGADPESPFTSIDDAELDASIAFALGEELTEPVSTGDGDITTTSAAVDAPHTSIEFDAIQDADGLDDEN